MTTLEAVRGELAERRERLAGLAVTVRESELVELLRRVDSALERLDGGTWGRCAACEGSVEPDRLSADPLLTLCLDCLSPSERRALERDLETAARVQAALLPPRELRYDGWEVALLWQPLGVLSGERRVGNVRTQSPQTGVEQGGVDLHPLPGPPDLDECGEYPSC